jgi:cell division septum initiation protein DivIVA
MMRTENLELISGENSKLKKINSQLLEEIKCLKVELEQRRDEMMYNSRVIELQNELNFARTNSNSEKSPESSRMLEQINDLSKQIARLKQ